MPFRKGDPNINRRGRAKKSAQPKQLASTSIISELSDPRLPRLIKRALVKVLKEGKPGQVVSGARELINRIEGLPNKAKPDADAVTEATGRKLCELAELLMEEQLCPKCGHRFSPAKL